MGTSTFADFFEFSYENGADKDLFAVHVDDFLGIPWPEFQNNTALPAVWVSRVQTIANGAAASGKTIFLALGPLAERKTLAGYVNASGSKVENWAAVDSAGCYPFATDANAANYKTAYIRYVNYMLAVFRPTYLGIVTEMNVEFTKCPSQKAAFIQWYSDVYQAVKQAHPDVILFPTWQMEHLYGVAEDAAWCGGAKTDASLAACFQQRLNEIAIIPSDRMAFSSYPTHWKYPSTAPNTFTTEFPYDDTFTRVQRTTNKKILISETGWPGVDIYNTYAHTTPVSTCGTILVPTPSVAGEANLTNHMSRLLAQAQSKQFEAVVWWSNRDFMDHTVSGSCPCVGTSATCTQAEQLYTLGGSSGEFAWRAFGNMGLRYKDGTPRTSAYNVWASYLSQPRVASLTLSQIQVYPNPLRTARGHTGMNFSNLPASARLQIFTVSGEKVKTLNANTLGFVTWDGTTATGSNAASGVYIVLIEGGGEKKKLMVAIQR